MLHNKFKNITFRNTISILAILLLTGIFYLVNQSLPFVMDDALYAHIYPVNPEDNGNPHCLEVEAEIQSFGDVLTSQWHHYFTKNGRGLVHLVVQCFCGLWGKAAYNICSTAVFVLFLLLLGWRTREGAGFGIPPMRVVLAFLLFMLLIPEPTCLYDGIAYGVNYLWSSVYCLGFLYLLFNGKIQKYWAIFLFLLLAFVAGWSHEGLVIAIGGGLVVWLWYRHFKLEPYKWVALAVFCCGAGLLVLAPSNFARAEGMSGDDGAAWAGGVLALHLRAFHFMRASYVWIILFLFFRFRHVDRTRQFARDNVFWISAWIIALAFIVAVGALNTRAVYGVDFFAVMLLLKLIWQFDFIKRNESKVGLLSALVLSVGSVWVLSSQLKASAQYDKMDEILSVSESTDCLVLVKDETPSWWVKRYVCQYKFDEPWEDWENRVLTWRYRKHKVLIAEVKEPDNVTSLEQCMVGKYKVPGDNPFYQIGNNLFSTGDMPSRVEMEWSVGNYNAHDPVSFLKLCFSIFRPADHAVIGLSLPVEEFEFQNAVFSRVSLSASNDRDVVSMDIR